MKIAIIGRGDLLFKVMKYLIKNSYDISLIITSKEAPEYKYGIKEYKKFAQELNINFFISNNLNKIVHNCTNKIDIGISINFVNIISQNFIDRFPLGILNMHGGDLPKYRGNACQSWAILNKEKEIVLCIHKMIGEELDSGDIVIKKNFPICINTRIGEIYKKFEKSAPKLFLKALQMLGNDPSYFFEKQSANSNHILRCYPRKKEDGRINFNRKAEMIIRLINSSSEPYSGAFCKYNNKILVIWRAVKYKDNENFLAIPGQVCEIKKDGSIIVACKKTKICITEIEYEGIRCLPNIFIKSLRDRLE